MATASIAPLGRASEFALSLATASCETSWLHTDGCSSSCLPFFKRPTSEPFDGELDSASTSGSEHNEQACLTDGESDSEADEAGDSASQLPFTYRCTNSIIGMPVARALPPSTRPISFAMGLPQMYADQAGLVSADAGCTFGMDSETDATGMSMPYIYGQSFGTPFVAEPPTMPLAMSTFTGNEAYSRHAFESAPAQHRQKRTCEANAKRRTHMVQKDLPTTICFRNLPNNYTTQMVLDLLNASGLGNSYDFVYVPHDFKRLPSLVNVGYFFVNFVSHAVAESAMKKLVGFRNWGVLSTKVLTGSWAERTQGKAACIERCKYFTFMHNDIPNACKPMMFERGIAVHVGEFSN